MDASDLVEGEGVRWVHVQGLSQGEHEEVALSREDWLRHDIVDFVTWGNLQRMGHCRIAEQETDMKESWIHI